MHFSYYKRLSTRQKRIYDQSDAVPVVRLPGAADLAPRVAAVGRALERDDRAATELAARELTDEVLRRLHLPPVRFRVLAVRPTENWGELHGLYEFGGRRAQPRITIWMRTAQRRKVVAFRTFLRTLLHEIGHHLDYEMLSLEDSFHTQGFYKRESSLFHQLLREVEKPKPEAPVARRARSRATGPKKEEPSPTLRRAAPRPPAERKPGRVRPVTDGLLPFEDY